jgi:membrane dipeptidase
MRLDVQSVIDLHADLLSDVIKCRQVGQHKVLERRHFPKLEKGGVSALITPIWVESKYRSGGAVKRALSIVDALSEDVKESTRFVMATSSKEIAEAESRGKIAMVLGCEGGEFIDDDIGILRVYYRLGLRSFGLVWNDRNLIADGMYHERDDRGLTDFGKEVIRELDRLRIILDLAHIAPKSFWGAVDVAKGPVIVSHGATVAHKSLRNSTDQQLKAVAESGGTFGVFAVNKGDTRDLRAYVDHIMHAIKVAGIEHVSLGPDFYDYLMDDLKADDNVMPPMVGLEDHSKLQAVPRELRRRGLSEDEISLVAKRNFLRVMKKVVG